MYKRGSESFKDWIWNATEDGDEGDNKSGLKFVLPNESGGGGVMVGP